VQGGGVWAHRYDRQGVAQGAKIVVAKPMWRYSREGTKVLCQENGFLVVWDDIRAIMAQRYFTDGAPDGPPFQVNPSGTEASRPITVTGTAGGQALIAWHAARTTREFTPVFVQRFEFRPGENCPGDCDVDGSVGIDELVIAVRIATDNVSIDRCRLVDADDDGSVAVNDLVVALINAMRGCE
jgi:hypothetical protein